MRGSAVRGSAVRGSAVRMPSPEPGTVPSGAGGTLRSGKRSGRGTGSNSGEGGSVPAARALRTHFLWGGGCLSLLPPAAGCFGRRLRACRANTAGRRTTEVSVRMVAQPPAASPRFPSRYLSVSSSSLTLPPGPCRHRFRLAQPSRARPCPAPPSRLPRRVRAPSTGRQQRHPRCTPPPERRGRGGATAGGEAHLRGCEGESAWCVAGVLPRLS